MRRLVIFVLVMASAASLFAQEKAAPKKQNICYIESIEVNKGTSFPVKVYVANVDSLAGMQVPIYYRSEDVDLKCDSVSFQGSRCAYFAANDSKIEPVGKTVFFAFILMVDAAQNIVPLPPGDGLVATLWFTAPKGIKSGKVKLDSGPNAFYPHEKIDYGYLFWTPAAEQTECVFKPGYIIVK